MGKNPPEERREPRRPWWEAPGRGAPARTRTAAWAFLPDGRQLTTSQGHASPAARFTVTGQPIWKPFVLEDARMDTLATDTEVATYTLLKRLLQSRFFAAHLPLDAAADVVFGSLCELCVLFYIEERHAQGLVTEDTRCEIDIPGLVARRTGPLKRSLRARRRLRSSLRAWQSMEPIQSRPSPRRPARSCRMPSGVS